MSLSKPNSDKNRNLLPPPPGRQISREQGMRTMFQLTEKTGLTNEGQIAKGSPMPAMARIFSAFPTVTRQDIVQPYRGMIVRR